MSVHMLGGNRSRRGERKQRLRTQSPVPEPKVSHDDIPSTASHAARATSCNRLDASAVNRQEQEDRSKLDEQQENISWLFFSKNNQADAKQQHSPAGSDSSLHSQNGSRNGAVRSCSDAACALEQREARRTKGASEAEGHLGDSRSPTDRQPNARARVGRPCDRQQIEVMRPGEAARPRCMPWEAGCRACRRYATENSAARAIEITEQTRE